MNKVRIFFLVLSLTAELKHIIVPLKKFSHQKALDILERIYGFLDSPEITLQEFLSVSDRFLTLFSKIVDLFWFLSPETFHKIVWSIIGSEQWFWNWGIMQAQKFLSNYINFDPDLEDKINYHVHQYNLRVLEALVQKDLEMAVKLFDAQFKDSVEEAIDEFKKKHSSDVPPVGNWLYIIDGNGIRENTNHKI